MNQMPCGLEYHAEHTYKQQSHTIHIHYTNYKQLCEQNNVRGYPTIKYYLDGEEHDYEGARSFDDLNAFIAEELASKCTFTNVEKCSDKGKGYIVKWSEKSVEDRKKEVERLEKMGTGSMKADLKKWVKERTSILKSGLGGDEL